MQRTAYSSMPTSTAARCRDSSGDELDVFEAARYFSGGFDGVITGRLSFQRTLRQELLFKGDRRSLDVPMKKPKTPSSHEEPHKMQRDYNETKSKQPAGGGRLSSFLISLFHQRSSKKKTTKSLQVTTTTQSMKENGDFEMVKHGQERRRRTQNMIMISGDHHHSCCSKPMHSSSKSSSGFRTPPPLPCMPKEKDRVHGSGLIMGSGDHHHDQGHGGKSSVRDQEGTFVVKNVGFGRREEEEVEEEEEEEEVGEGGSDSSSDLFELKNYGLEEFSINCTTN